MPTFIITLSHWLFSMRLSKVRLAGFKSFVDPTTFILSGNLNGIVGPNGCGKSNIIDAVRWVMGESSAKQLRGESMTDVIFNGSISRKPASQASIELVFDNTTHSIGGQWATFTEISIKRTLSRDGTSNYFLNGTKCRRKDITDIFLGTGLGPRSYAIIEQGMISRVIESRPEELRHFFEEAAGISKYKERRKETEIRIEHTRENLNRLLDVREELNVQYQNLSKQAKIAQKYQALKAEQRQTNYEYLFIQHMALDNTDQLVQQNITAIQSELDINIVSYDECMNQIATQQQINNDYSQTLAECTTQYHLKKENIIRLDAEIKTSQALNAHMQKEQLEWQQRLTEINQHRRDDQTELCDMEDTLTEIMIKVDHAEDLLQEHEKSTQYNEENSLLLYNQHTEIQRALNELERERDVIKNSLVHQENHELEQARLLSKIKLQLTEPESDLDQMSVLEVALAQHQQSVMELEHASLNFETLKHSTYQQLSNIKKKISEIQTKRAENLGKLKALETLQSSIDMPRAHHSQYVPLHTAISTEPRFERAVEASLKHWLMMPVLYNAESELGFSGLVHITFTPEDLGFYVTSSLGLGCLLSHIKIASSLVEAQKMRPHLLPHQWIVLENGTLMGKDWFLPFDETDVQAGVIARAQEIAQLKEMLESDAIMLDELAISADNREQELTTIENKLNIIREEMSMSSNESHKIENKIQLLKQSNQHAELERSRLTSERYLIENNLIELHAEISDNRGRLETLLIELEALQDKHDKCAKDKTAADDYLQQSKIELKTLQYDWLNLSKSLDALKAKMDAKKLAITRANLEFNNLNDKLSASIAESKLQNDSDHIKALEEQLNQEHKTIALLETEQNLLIQKINQANQQIDEYRTQQKKLEANMIACREKLQSFSLSKAESNAHKTHLEESLKALVQTMDTAEISLIQAELEINRLTIDQNITENIQILKEKINDLEAKIEKIGAVNLMAIDECAALEVRKNYLEEQDKDLNDALTMLEKAIKNIDQETRGRFKETFDQVNTSFKALFPTLFGGGEAGLTLTEEDVLVAGVTIIARPPGKRPGTIHLLSGGEKALTAVALVFAIFNLNPAPFCMLDEVDAPLDDANVERYGNLLKQMSSTVQFIFITHNKGAMAVADYLIGVTMSEPGVSRLVSVDMEQALAFIETDI